MQDGPDDRHNLGSRPIVFDGLADLPNRPIRYTHGGALLSQPSTGPAPTMNPARFLMAYLGRHGAAYREHRAPVEHLHNLGVAQAAHEATQRETPPPSPGGAAAHFRTPAR